MKYKIIKEENQARGAFDFGRIKENKPVGFPHESGQLNSISNLFYWAHAWSDEGGLIAEHPHQGFEIMSYVIRGELSHYDNKNNEWRSLKAGGAQLIKAGNGITHSEKFMPNTAIFQIWLDPDLRKTLSASASYMDVAVNQFENETFDGYSQKQIVGFKSPLNFESEGISMYEILAEKGKINIEMNSDHIYLFYIIHGGATISEELIKPNDVLYMEESDDLILELTEKTRLFQISIPKKLTYQTYAQSQSAS